MTASCTFAGVQGDPRRDGIARERGLVHEAGLLIDPTIYLPALLDDVQQAGAEIVQRTLGSRADLDGIACDVFVNCTGLGARALVGDDTLVPIKGQLVHLPPDPSVRAMIIDEAAGAYILPRPTSIVLGGSFVPGDWSLEPDAAATARILAAAKSLMPRIISH